MYAGLVSFCPDVLVEYHTATNPSAEPKSMLIYLVDFCLSADVDVFSAAAGPIFKLTMFDKSMNSRNKLF